MDIKKYSTQCHTQQHKDHLNVHWDTITICQLNCAYCYARNDYGRDWGKLASKTTIDIVLDALERSSLNFNLGMLGGEPTIGPHYKYILDKVSSFEKNIGIYVTTNGERDLSNDNTPKNTAFLFSYHPADCTNKDQFLSNVKFMKDNGYKCKVNVVLHPAKKYWQDIKDTIDIVLSYGVKVHPHFLYGNWDRKLYQYNKDFWDFFDFLENMEKDLKFDEDLFNDYQVYKYKLTNFKGWSCFNNNYEIDINANVVQFCKEKSDNINLLRDRDFFKNIKETKPMICPHTECNCDGLLKQLKVRND